VGREGRAKWAVGVKGVHGVAGQRDERAVGLVCLCYTQCLVSFPVTARQSEAAWNCGRVALGGLMRATDKVAHERHISSSHLTGSFL
jgi:nicotinamide mononucleotide (NMN) deamidase PncC